MSDNKTKNLLSNLGDALLLIGNVFSKVFLVVPASILIKTIPQSILILGNTSWATANAFGPQAQREKNRWYGFAGYNTQQIMAAFLGGLAATLTIASFFIPVFLPIATWVAALGNVIWTTSEYHRNNNKNPDDNHETAFKQQFYWKYSLAMTGVSFVAAINATLIFIFPPATLVATIITAAISTVLIIPGLINLLESKIKKPPSPDDKPSKTPKETAPNCTEPSVTNSFTQHYCFKSLFQSSKSRNPQPNPVESHPPRSPKTMK